jgi:hypothetical protein
MSIEKGETPFPPVASTLPVLDRPSLARLKAAEIAL